MLIRLRSCGPFNFLLSMLHLIYGFRELLVVENIQQIVDCLFTVERARFDMLPQYLLGVLYRFNVPCPGFDPAARARTSWRLRAAEAAWIEAGFPLGAAAANARDAQSLAISGPPGRKR
jgi:hypothetical protein